MLAAVDAGEPDHERVTEAIRAAHTSLITTDFVLAEVDFLVLKRLGVQAELALLEQFAAGIFWREQVKQLDLSRAQEIIVQYSEHKLGITDASLMALSERLGIREVLTLDRRHFGVFRDRRGQALALLPEPGE